MLRNTIFSAVHKQQVKEDLPWIIKGLIRIASILGIDLDAVLHETSQNEWNWKVATKRKLNETITREFEEEIKNTKRYEGNIEDDIYYQGNQRNIWD